MFFKDRRPDAQPSSAYRLGTASGSALARQTAAIPGWSAMRSNLGILRRFILAVEKTGLGETKDEVLDDNCSSKTLFAMIGQRSAQKNTQHIADPADENDG